MAEDQGKEEEKFDFTGEGEAAGYISLEQAGVLAMRTASETPGEYGSSYQGMPMAFEVAVATEDEDFYNITLSFRPQTAFSGTPGQEQFFIEKEGTVAHRQVLDEPRRRSRLPVLPVAIGLVIVGLIVAAAVVFAVRGGEADGELVAVVAPAETPASIVVPILPTDTPTPPPAAEPIVVEKEAITEIVKEIPAVKEVIKEVPVEKEVTIEKEVIKEVPVTSEVTVVITPTDTPIPPTDSSKPLEYLISLQPDNIVDAGQPVYVEIEVRNPGHTIIKIPFQVTLNRNPIGQPQYIELDGRGKKNLRVPLGPLDPGNYRVDVDGWGRWLRVLEPLHLAQDEGVFTNEYIHVKLDSTPSRLNDTIRSFKLTASAINKSDDELTVSLILDAPPGFLFISGTCSISPCRHEWRLPPGRQQIMDMHLVASEKIIPGRYIAKLEFSYEPPDGTQQPTRNIKRSIYYESDP